MTRWLLFVQVLNSDAVTTSNVSCNTINQSIFVLLTQVWDRGPLRHLHPRRGALRRATLGPPPRRTRTPPLEPPRQIHVLLQVY